MLIIVIANPMHTTIVIADPRTSAGALRATSAENCGESAAIVNPQNNMMRINIAGGRCHRKGEIKQQMPEESNAKVASEELPMRIDKIPPP